MKALKFIYSYLYFNQTMNELIQILCHKLTIISEKREFKGMTVAQKDQLLDSLMMEKKQQSLRVLVETRLQQAITTRHINHDQQIKEFTIKSYDIMKINVPNLELKAKQKPLQNLINLYLTFFNKVGGTQRAKEIQTLSEKKLCPESLVPSTLFNWLVEWTRKQFKEYLKTNIHSLYVDSRQPIHFTHKEEKDKQSPQTNNQHQPADPFLIIHKKSILQEKNQREIVKERKEMPKSLEDLRVGSPIGGSLKRLPKLPEGATSSDGPINKQVFLFAFTDEFQAYYKTLEDCLEDLEVAWARRLKRGGRRDEVLRRLPEIALSYIKQMPHIKQSIDTYNQYYKSCHEGLGRVKSPKSPRTEPAVDDKLKFEKQQSQISKAKRKRKQSQSPIDRKLKKSERYSNLSQRQLALSDRQISTTDKKVIDRRKQLLQSITNNHRYQLDDQYGSQSNLLPSTSRTKKRQEYSLDISHKTLDLNLGEPHQESRILWLNSSGQGNQLEIIEERVKKMKLKVMHGRPLRGSVSKGKGERKKKELNRSLDLKEGTSIEYRSLPVGVEQISSIKLPPIRRKR